jgi:TM2 domain-containing membrane protein YozV
MSSPPDPESLRIGTAEREEANRLLGEHFAEGRLSMDEYETRVSAAYAATTRADLRGLFGDLPQPHPGFLRPPPEPYPYAPPPAPVVPVPMRPYLPMPMPMSPKSKTVAGVLQIVLPFGAGRFYTGHVGMAIAQLFVTLITLGFGAIWPVIDGIVLLANGGTDAYGRPLAN